MWAYAVQSMGSPAAAYGPVDVRFNYRSGNRLRQVVSARPPNTGGPRQTRKYQDVLAGGKNIWQNRPEV